MRILHVYVSLDPAQGGPPVVLEHLSAAQARLGHEVRIAAEVIVGAPPVPAATLPRHSSASLLAAPPAADVEQVTWADVVHLHGIWEPLLPSMARAARRAGKPYVLSPHGMLDPWSLNQKKWKKRLALLLGYKRMLNNAAALHVLNRDERDLIAPLGLSVPCEIVPIGIPFEQFDPLPDPAPFRASLPGLDSRPFVLFVSRLHPKKGLDFLADAFAAVAPTFPDCDLVVAGPDGGAEAMFRQRVEQLGLTPRVRLVGFLSDEMKRSALAAATVFCLPSRQEGFSMAILEALACRLPVVVSDHCHFPEVAEVGAGRVVTLDAASVAKALSELLADAGLRLTMGAAGRAMVAERFTWPKVAEQFVALYGRVAKLNP